MRSVLLAIVVAASAHAQAARGQAIKPTPAQDSSLTGIRTISLTTNAPDSGKAFTLELRKAGIHVVRPGEPADAQLIFFLQYVQRGGGLMNPDGAVSLQVVQPVQISRLAGRTLWVPTWITETISRGNVGPVDAFVAKSTKEILDDFISRWLGANGR